MDILPQLVNHEWTLVAGLLKAFILNQSRSGILRSAEPKVLLLSALSSIKRSLTLLLGGHLGGSIG